MFGSKLPRSDVGFWRPPVARRTSVWTYSPSSSAVTIPSRFSSAEPSKPFHDVIREDAVPAAPFRTFERLLTIAAGGQREKATGQGRRGSC